MHERYGVADCVTKYMPRECVTVVYIHPRANEDNAAREIERVVHELQSDAP